MNDTIQHLESDKVKQKTETEDNNTEEEADNDFRINSKTKNWFQLIVLSVIKRYSVLRTRARYLITGSPTTANVFARYVYTPFDLTYPGRSNYFGIHLDNHIKHTAVASV